MDQLLTHWLRIRHDERRRTALLFLFLFFSTSYIVVGRAARDALLLSRMGVAHLPVVYVAVAAASSVVVLLYNRLLRRWSPSVILRAVLVVAVVALLGLRLLIEMDWRGSYHTLYVFHEVAGSMLSVLFWTFANESFTTREAKRLFGVIGSGGVMAGTVFGFGGAYLAPRLGTANLLLVCAVLLIACLVVLAVIRSVPRTLHEADALEEAEPELRRYLPYARTIAALAVVTAVAASIVDFEFKAVSQQYFGEDALASFFGILYGCCGLLSFFFHLLFTGRLLTRTGILPALLTLPIALSLGAVGLVTGPLLVLVVYEKAVDATLRYSLNETCVQLLYFPLPVRLRRRLKAVVEGGVKPLAIGLTGVAFMYLGPGREALIHLAWVLLVMLLVWIAIAPVIKRHYVSALLAGLTRRGMLDSGVSVVLSDMASTQALIEALRSKDPPIVLEALELLPAHRGTDWTPHVTALLERPDPRIRAAVLAYCRHEQIPLEERVLDDLLLDEDDEVRAAAVDFVRRPESLGVHLADPSPAVRAKVIVALVRNSVALTSETALEELDAMAHDDDPESRLRAAWAMGELATNEVGLRRLLHDPSLDVQREALEAAGKAQFIDMVPLLIDRLKDPTTGDEAAVALGRYGDTALGRLLDLFPLQRHGDVFRHNYFVALKKIGTKRVVESLLHRLPEHRAMRNEVLQAAFQILRTRKEGPLRLDQVRTPFLVEVRDCYQWWAIAEALAEGSAAWELLRGVVVEEAHQARERAFLLLGLVYPIRPMLALIDTLARPPEGKRANAIELVDELIDQTLRRMLMPLLDDLDTGERVARGKELFPLVVQSGVDWCRYFLRAEDRWLTLCCLNTAGRLGDARLLGDVRSLLESPDALVREEAVCALAHLLDDTQWASVAREAAGDPAPAVRRLVEARCGGGTPMISSVDKVLFLKKVALFSQLPSRELLNLASIAQEVSYPESSVLLREGDEGDSLYLILSGEVAVQTGGRTIAVLGPRECVGEMAILDREPRSATVVALDHVTALRIERDSFYEVLAQKREIALGIIRILVRRLRGANIRPEEPESA